MQWEIYPTLHNSWWRHQMETFSALLAICAGNSPVSGEFPAQRPVTRSIDISLICAYLNGWVNTREAGDLRHYRAHYHAIVMRSEMRTFLFWMVNYGIWNRCSVGFVRLLYRAHTAIGRFVAMTSLSFLDWIFMLVIRSDMVQFHVYYGSHLLIGRLLFGCCGGVKRAFLDVGVLLRKTNPITKKMWESYQRETYLNMYHFDCLSFSTLDEIMFHFVIGTASTIGLE